MRITMRLCILFVAALVGSVYACKSQPVVSADRCSEPCCGGDPSRVDCGETPAIACIESGDPCTAQTYGCVGGQFFQRPQATLPASCAATDSAVDGTTAESDGNGTFGQGPGPDATNADLDAMDAGLDAADTRLDAAPDALPDAGPDAPTDAGPDALTDASLDGTADGSP
jgi:hypothetical protein